MSFLDYLRDRDNKELKHPVSFGFSVDKWTEYFRRQSDGSLRDQSIYGFGLFLHQRLEKVRECLQQLEQQSPFLSQEEVVLRIVRQLNDGYMRVQRVGFEAMQGKDYISIEEIGHGRTQSSSTGARFTQQEILEKITDFSRHVLRSAMRKNKGYGAPQPVEPVWGTDESLLAAGHLAQFYDSFENQWQGALWADAAFNFDDFRRIYQLSEIKSSLSVESTIDLVRRAGKYHRDIEEVRSHQLSADTMDELVLYKNANGEIEVRRLGDLPEALRDLVLSLAYQRLSLTESSSLSLMGEAHGTVESLTVKKVYDAWLRLGGLAVQGMLECQEHNWDSQDYKSRLTLTISEPSLISALAKALQITEAQAEEVVNYFVFDGSIEQTLWQRPILRNQGGLLMAWFPLMAFHPMRLISSWAKEAKHLRVSNNKRGWAFERDVVHGLLFASAHCPLREKPFVIGPGINVTDPSVGDIDALLILGDTAFVLECRNLMHPATPHEFWDVESELKVKIAKAIRKRDYLKENPSVLLNIMQESPFSPLARKINKVIGVVVSNSYMLEGTRDVEPYFVHVDTLFNTILTGGPMFEDIEAGDKTITFHVDYFKSNITPADALIHSIASPAKAEYYRRQLVKADFPIPGIDQTEPVGAYIQWIFSPPETGTLRTILSKCSFAPYVVAHQNPPSEFFREPHSPRPG